jgi:hypothetical protein
MNKTHMPDLSINGPQCHNRQLTLHFCAILSVGMSVRSGTQTSVGMSAGSSDGTGNMVCFAL